MEVQEAYDEWQNCVKYHRVVWFMPYIPPLSICRKEYERYIKSITIIHFPHTVPIYGLLPSPPIVLTSWRVSHCTRTGAGCF